MVYRQRMTPVLAVLLFAAAQAEAQAVPAPAAAPEPQTAAAPPPGEPRLPDATESQPPKPPTHKQQLRILPGDDRMEAYQEFRKLYELLTPEAAGKLNFYVNVVDDQLRTEHEAATIGLLLCRTRSDVVVRYALSGVATPMAVAGFTLADLPRDARSALPIERLLIDVVAAGDDSDPSGEE